MNTPNKATIDKVLLKFITDVMYIKGIICYQEYDAIMECSNHIDLDCVFEKMMNDGYNGYIRGECDWEIAQML